MLKFSLVHHFSTRLSNIEITGGSQSLTVTAWVQVAVLPHSSVAVQVIVVVPQGYRSVNSSPSLRVPVIIGAESQLSLAVAVPGSRSAEQSPGSLQTSTFAGQVMVGGVISRMVIITVSVSGTPHWSVTVSWKT